MSGERLVVQPSSVHRPRLLDAAGTLGPVKADHLVIGKTPVWAQCAHGDDADHDDFRDSVGDSAVPATESLAYT
jgi:hypothetical protein